MNITVYLGANEGRDPDLKKAARELGTWIGGHNNTLIYGGSKCGLMGELAESTLLAGGRVIGVEQQFFIDMGFEYDAVSELIVTQNMSERKAKMIELGDAFIAFPGGTGTLEEISEVISCVRLGLMDAPAIIYNLDGYYEPLRLLMDRMVQEEFLDRRSREKVFFASSIGDIEEILNRKGSGGQ